MEADSSIYVASVTKLYTATAVMRLYEKGALSLSDPMAKYLPQALIRGINVYGGTDYSSEIIIGDLLSHRSGIADYYTERAKDGKSPPYTPTLNLNYVGVGLREMDNSFMTKG